MDFVADVLSDGRKLRALTISNNCTWEWLAIEVEQYLRGVDIVRVLESITRIWRPRQTIKVDNKSEFISTAIDT